jgi:hypothetical protein
MKTLYPLLSVFFLFPLASSAQNEANIWYFGNNAGLDFNSGSPVVLNNSAMSAFEGCSSISDDNGDILFYTDAMTVWNKNHEIMSNGSGLYGNSSTTQCLIIKQPQSSGLYYIFTIDAQLGTWGLRYSIVDMSLQNGLGDITDKNIPISDQSTEKLCAVKKSGSEIWVMTHEWDSNTFAAYLLDENGLSSFPVGSSVGTIIDGNSANTIGYMKFSPDGTRLGYSIDYDLKRVEVFDFDKTTGEISNSLVLSSYCQGFGYYGLEFSPNGQVLYAANEGLTGPGVSHVYQWNLAAGSDDQIIASKDSFGAMDNAGALQLAPDGKIYLAETNTNFVGVINNPDVVGEDCDFIQDAIDLSPGEVKYGLPGFNTSIFEYIFFSANDFCYKDSTQFFLTDSSNVDSVIWNFDDPQSGVNNSSSLFNPFHVFTASGEYDIELLIFINGSVDTVINSISINDAPIISLGNDTALCSNESFVLSAGSFLDYLWQDGSTDSSITITSAGQYYVQVTSENGCLASDTLLVSSLSLPDFSLGEDTAICDGSILILNPNNAGPIYLWQDGSPNSTYTASDEGIYWVKITNQNGCSTADSIFIDVLPSPPVPYIIYANGTLISSIYLGNQWYLNGTPIPGANLNYYVPY